MKRSVLIVALLGLGGCQTYPAHPPECPPGQFKPINPTMTRGDAFKSDTSDSQSQAKPGAEGKTNDSVSASVDDSKRIEGATK